MLRSNLITVLVLAIVLTAGLGDTLAEDGQKLSFSGINYTKFLWGTQRHSGSLYNFTTIPGEGYGDNGQGTELEILLHSKPSSKIEVSGRVKARFNQNFWTNFGGFPTTGGTPGTGDCVGGDCGEFDSRSAQYMKFRGLTVTITPGYSWINQAMIGASDWGMFDAFSIGKIRYIDRDNGSGLLFSGKIGRKINWDLARISLPRVWAGPGWTTGEYTSMDAQYGAQAKWSVSRNVDVRGVFAYTSDTERHGSDINLDDGQDLIMRFRNSVVGGYLGWRPTSVIDLNGAYYYATTWSNPDLAPAGFGAFSGFGNMVANKPATSNEPPGGWQDPAWYGNLNLNDPFNVGLDFNFQYFDIGANYVANMAARRESDVLLTEGHDGAWALPGPANDTFGVYPGNPSRIGYGGWQGEAQQVATLSVDNEFTDFDEPMAETVIGWNGFTAVVPYGSGDFDISGEFTWIDYNTNWQNWKLGPSHDVNTTPYPTNEGDVGVGSFRNAYAPFQKRTTYLYALKASYYFDSLAGIELFGKFKYIDEEDKRMDDPFYLPYNTNGTVNNSNTSTLYRNPDTGAGEQADQWKQFDDLADDDRLLDYKLYQLGAGKQLSDELYASLTYEYYNIDLLDGNTAFQAYGQQAMMSGLSKKNKLQLYSKYIIGGAEFGLAYEWNWGTFEPNFGTDYTPQTAADAGVDDRYPADSLGFTTRMGGWNSLLNRDFRHDRMKAYMKLLF